MQRDEVFAQVRSLIRGSNLKAALEILEKYLKANSKDADAWWLAAQCVPSKQKQISCVERVLKINPDFPGARQRLDALVSGKTPETDFDDLVEPDTDEAGNQSSDELVFDDLEEFPVSAPKRKAVQKSKTDEDADLVKQPAANSSADRFWLIGLSAAQAVLFIALVILGLSQFMSWSGNRSQLASIEEKLKENAARAVQAEQSLAQIQIAMNGLDSKLTSQQQKVEQLASRPTGPTSNPPAITIPAGRQRQPVIPPNNPVTQSNPIAAEPDGEKAAKEDVIIKLPQTLVDAIPTDGGKFIVLKLQNFPGLMIIDPIQKKMIGSISLPSEDFLFAAGGRNILIFFKENNLFNVFDVETRQSKKVRPNPVGTTVTTLTMGHSLGKLALVRSSNGTDALSQTQNYLLDVDNLEALVPDQADGPKGRQRGGIANTTGHSNSYRDYVHRRSNSDLTIVTEWCTSHSPGGIGLIFPRSAGAMPRYEHNSAGYLAMGDDQRVYAQGGAVYNSQLVDSGKVSGTPYPGLGGSLFLVLQNGIPSIFQSGTTRPLVPMSPLKGIAAQNEPWAQRTFLADRRIVFAPNLGYMLYFPTSNSEAIVRPFELEKLLQKSGVDYLVVTSEPSGKVKPGESWTYQMKVLSKKKEPVKYTLQANPDGMAISDSGKITWNVPGSFQGPQKIVVLVEVTGESTFHTFELSPEV